MKAMLAALETPDIEGEIVNLGSSNTRTMREILEVIQKETGADAKDVVIDKTRLRPKDVKILVTENSKARKILGWKPTTTFEEGIRRTIDWYVDNGEMWGYEKSGWSWRY